MLIAVDYTSYFEALSALFMDLSKQCPRFTEYQALYPTSTRLQKALCDFHASIIRCCKHVVEAIQRPWQKQLRLAFFHSFEQEFAPDVNNIRSHGRELKDEVALAKAQVDHQDQELRRQDRVIESKLRSGLKKFIPKVEREIEATKDSRLQQSRRRSIKERQRLLEFLSMHPHLNPFKEARKKHQCDTAEWIFKTPEFARWYDGTGAALLWCSGKIGSGKTVLCANVINYVLVNKGLDDRATFFFLQYDNSDSLTADTIIRSIIRQSIDAIALSEDVEQHLVELDRKPFVELQDWVRLLRQRIEQSSTFFIFIDGLDECDSRERRAVLDALSSLSAAVSSLRIFIASRDSVYLDLRGRFPRIEHASMAPDVLSGDIILYVEAAIRDKIRNEDLVFGDPDLLNEIRDTLTRHVDGMFLWVVFLMDEICTASCDGDIRQSLRNLPKDLEDTFTRALSRIMSRQRLTELVQKVFRWVVAAKRPLTLHEIREAVSIDIGQSSIEPERLVRELSPIDLWCENLLQVTEEELPTVQFAHSTIRDFITEANLPAQLASFHVDLDEADHFAGEICVTYLHFNDFKRAVARRSQPVRVDLASMAGTALEQEPMVAKLAMPFVGLVSRHRKAKAGPDLSRSLANFSRPDADRSLDLYQQGHPFLEYAAKHWISHTANFQKGRSVTWRLWHDIIPGDHGLAHLPWQESPFSQSENPILTWSHQTRHYALLRYANGVTESCGPKQDKLMWISASEGDSEAIAIFLDAGCSTPSINGALARASKGGHLNIVKQLVDAGADVNAATFEMEERTALGAASRNGHLEVVEQLLDSGADVNNIWMPLQEASRSGHHEVVERLLDAGADVNGANAAVHFGWTALVAASKGGHLNIVKQLVDAGADVNAATFEIEESTALGAASRNGHLKVVEQLLRSGANVAAAYREARTPLQAASEGGHLEVVERLLGFAADVNAVGDSDEGWSALQRAVQNGRLEVVERLLDAGADVNFTANDVCQELTALYIASERGYFEIVERLLDIGVDVDSANWIGKTALHAASEGGHFAVVKQLLDAEANVALADQYGRTALHLASEYGHFEVVKQLLDAGADAAVANYLGRTPLQVAPERGHREVVERLLSAGAKGRKSK